MIGGDSPDYKIKVLDGPYPCSCEWVKCTGFMAKIQLVGGMHDGDTNSIHVSAKAAVAIRTGEVNGS